VCVCDVCMHTYVDLPLPVGPRTAFTPGRNIPLQVQTTGMYLYTEHIMRVRLIQNMKQDSFIRVHKGWVNQLVGTISMSNMQPPLIYDKSHATFAYNTISAAFSTFSLWVKLVQDLTTKSIKNVKLLEPPSTIGNICHYTGPSSYLLCLPTMLHPSYSVWVSE